MPALGHTHPLTHCPCVFARQNVTHITTGAGSGTAELTPKPFIRPAFEGGERVLPGVLEQKQDLAGLLAPSRLWGTGLPTQKKQGLPGASGQHALCPQIPVLQGAPASFPCRGPKPSSQCDGSVGFPLSRSTSPWGAAIRRSRFPSTPWCQERRLVWAQPPERGITSGGAVESLCSWLSL